jgi:putative ABC transport system ATP-binding protein
VFQFFHLVPRLSACENVELPMIFAGIPAAERRSRALARLQAVGLEQRAEHRPDQLSGGERQRVALARATVLEPKLLLADEPTGNLDTASGRHVLEILEQMNAAGLTLIVVTHDPAVARRARRVLVLKDGRVVYRGSGAQIHEAVEILSAAENGA